MLRVICMSLMNVIPVVTAIFGAAYAVQPAYGIGFSKDLYLWIPVLGNILAVLVIPFVGNLSDKIGRKPPIIVGALGSGLLSFGYLYAISIHNVPLAIVMSLLMWGVVYQGYNAVFSSLLPRAVPDADPGFGDGHLPEPRDGHHGHASGAVRSRGAPRLDQHPAHGWRDHLRHHGHRCGRGHDRPRDLPHPHERSRQTRTPFPSRKTNTTGCGSRALPAQGWPRRERAWNVHPFGGALWR